MDGEGNINMAIHTLFFILFNVLQLEGHDKQFQDFNLLHTQHYSYTWQSGNGQHSVFVLS